MCQNIIKIFLQDLKKYNYIFENKSNQEFSAGLKKKVIFSNMVVIRNPYVLIPSSILIIWYICQAFTG